MSLLTKWNPFRELQEAQDWASLTRWNPFREMEQMRQHMENILGRPALRGNGGHEETMTTTQWAPLVDIAEDNKEYLVKAELPELKKEDIKATLEHGVLTLWGERKFENEEKDKKYHRVERAYGSFTRSFSLPEDADPAKVSAEFKDGVLKVRVGKNEKAKTKAIEIRVS